MNKKTLTTEEISDKLEKDEDFILSSKYNNSLKKAIEDCPDGFENDKIAKFLNITTEEAEQIFKDAIVKLQKSMGV